MTRTRPADPTAAGGASTAGRSSALAWAPATVAWAGLRYRPGPWLLLALGVALAALLPVVSAGLQTESSAAAVRAAVDGLPAGSRAALAVTGRDLRGPELTPVDRTVRAGFAAAGLTSVQRALTFRPLAVGGTDVTVGAVDGLAADVRLTSGRAPRSCRPRACEVLAVTLPGSAPLDPAPLARSAASLGLVLTGTAVLTDPRPVGVRLVSADLPLLLGGDPDALARLTPLTLFSRNTAWFGSLDGSAVATRGVDRLTRTLAGVADSVNAGSGPLSVTWPVDAAAGAADRADGSAGRFAVLGAGAGGLQLGFCLLAAAGMRRRQQVSGRLLVRRGASDAQVLLVTVVQSVLAVALGLVTGLVLAGAVAAVRAGPGSPGRWSAAAQAVASGWPAPAVLALGAVLVTVAVTRWPASLGRSTQLVLDVVLVALVAATVLLLRGDGAAPAATVGGAAVVVLVAAATGLLTARVWSPLVVLAARLVRPGPGRDVALLGALRRPLPARVTAGFVAAAVCSLVFAGAYQGTLARSASDQAAAQVPLDVRVEPSASVAAPLDVLDVPRITAVSPDVAVHPVVSSSVTAFAGSSLATSLPLTGIDPDVLPAVHGLAATTGSDLSPAELADRLSVPVAPGGKPPAAVPAVPAGTRHLTLLVDGRTPDVTLSLWLATAEGREERVPLTGSGAVRTATLAPGPDRTVRALEIAESASHLVHRQHGVGEGSTDRALAAGHLVLGGAAADGRALSWPWTSWGSDQAQLSHPGPAALPVGYRVGDDRVVLTPGFTARTDLAALPVAVDPGTAARARGSGTFGVTVNGVAVRARVAAVLPRMPTLGPAFLLADRSAVTALLDRTAPGTAVVSQVWITAPGGSTDAVRRLLESSPAAAATCTYRVDLARRLAADPVAAASVALLVSAGVVALLLAVVGLATAVRGDLEDSAADHLALELDGLTPRRLRRLLLLRWTSTLVGIPLGALGGWVLAAAALRVLVTGPDGGPVDPPLRLVVLTPATGLALAAAVLVGLAACGLASATAFRGPRPGSPDLDLR